MTEAERINVLSVRSRLAGWKPDVVESWIVWCTKVVQTEKRRVRLDAWEARIGNPDIVKDGVPYDDGVGVTRIRVASAFMATIIPK